MNLYSEEDNNISSFNFGLNLEAELRLAQHKEQYQDFEVQASNDKLIEELDPSFTFDEEEGEVDDNLVIQIPELADELQELKLKEEEERKKELLENNNSINLKYNSFLVDKMKYLNKSGHSIGSVMEYQMDTMDTITKQLNELKGILNGINKGREQQKIEMINKKKEKNLKMKTQQQQQQINNESNEKLNRNIKIRRRDSFTTLVNDENDTSSYYNSKQQKSKEIKPEVLFGEDIGFLRICKIMDIMVHDAYTAVTTLPS